MKVPVITVLLFILYYTEDFANCSKQDCAAVSCISQDELVQECLRNGEAFVFPDMKCDCCGHCASVKDVIDPKEVSNCDPNYCPLVRCYPQNITECKSNQIYAPSDGLCFCCPGCADKKRK